MNPKKNHNSYGVLYVHALYSTSPVRQSKNEWQPRKSQLSFSTQGSKCCAVDLPCLSGPRAQLLRSLVVRILLPVEVRKFVQLASFSLHVLEQNPLVKPQRKRELGMCLRLPYLIKICKGLFDDIGSSWIQFSEMFWNFGILSWRYHRFSGTERARHR